MILLWTKFLICALGILFTGYNLSKSGDILAEKLGLSKGLVGFVFLSMATAFPELITSVSAIIIVKSPNLATSNALGSVYLNLMIIALLDIVQRKGPILLEVKQNNTLYAGLTLISLGVVSLSIILRTVFGIHLGIANLGVDSLIILIIYFLGLRMIFQFEKTNKKEKESESSYEEISLKSALFRFSLSFVAVVFLGIWLAILGKEITKVMLWSETLVGTLFLALATSLPELAVSLTAFKFAVDMAIGNILGANFLDIAILPVCDIFFSKGQLLSHISVVNLITTSLAIILTSIVIVTLMYRSRKSFLKVGWGTIAMIAVFGVGSYLLIAVAK